MFKKLSFALLFLAACQSLAQETSGQTSYTVVASNQGSLPEDYDLIVIRENQTDTTMFMSFKLCSSHGPDGTPNEIAELRSLPFTHPEVIKSESQLQAIFEKLSLNSNCRALGRSRMYSRVGEMPNYFSNESERIGKVVGGMTALTGMLLYRGFRKDLSFSRSIQNTLSFRKTLLRNKFLAYVLGGTSLFFGTSGAFLYGGSLRRLDVQKKTEFSKLFYNSGSALILVDEPMTSYKERFLTNLNFAVQTKMIEAL